MRQSFVAPLVGILAGSVMLASPVKSQTLSLTGINIVGTDANGNIVEAFWTTDHTPTPANWFGIWTSATSGGAFFSGPAQNNLGIGLNVGTNNLYAVTDFAPPHVGPPTYVGFNLFFNTEIAPRISFVTPTSTFGSHTAIDASKAMPTLLYLPLTTASGALSFTQDNYHYSLTAFDATMGADRVYANLAQTDGFADPEFHFGLSVTAVPEPSTYFLFASGLLAIGGAAATRRRGHMQRQSDWRNE